MRCIPLLDNQKREIDGNKHLIFNLTMQRLNKIVRNLNIKTNKLANAPHFVLEDYVSFMSEDRTLKMGYIVHFSKEYVSIMHCNGVFDEEAVVKNMGSTQDKSHLLFRGRGRGEGE